MKERNALPISEVGVGNILFNVCIVCTARPKRIAYLIRPLVPSSPSNDVSVRIVTALATM